MSLMRKVIMKSNHLEFCNREHIETGYSVCVYSLSGLAENQARETHRATCSTSIELSDDCQKSLQVAPTISTIIKGRAPRIQKESEIKTEISLTNIFHLPIIYFFFPKYFSIFPLAWKNTSKH